MNNVQRLPPDIDGMNDERADWAGEALAAFARVTRMDSAGEDAATILSDLLGDLLHWCDRHDLDFEEQLERARGHYAAETGAAPY
jgi:hypothetical protein